MCFLFNRTLGHKLTYGIANLLHHNVDVSFIFDWYQHLHDLSQVSILWFTLFLNSQTNLGMWFGFVFPLIHKYKLSTYYCTKIVTTILHTWHFSFNLVWNTRIRFMYLNLFLNTCISILKHISNENNSN